MVCPCWRNSQQRNAVDARQPSIQQHDIPRFVVAADDGHLRRRPCRTTLNPSSRKPRTRKSAILRVVFNHQDANAHTNFVMAYLLTGIRRLAIANQLERVVLHLPDTRCVIFIFPSFPVPTHSFLLFFKAGFEFRLPAFSRFHSCR